MAHHTWCLNRRDFAGADKMPVMRSPGLLCIISYKNTYSSYNDMVGTNVIIYLDTEMCRL
jgi:hypothetical protein